VASLVAVGGGELGRNLTLGGASTLEGRVLQHGGEPIVGAAVTLTDVRGEVVAAAMAGRDGGYVLSELHPGEYTLTATAENTLPIARAVTVGRAGTHRFDVVLGSNVTIAGTIRATTSQQPVPDASVTLVDADGNVARTVVTAVDGRYEFTGLPPGAYTLTASGYPPVAVPVDLSGDRTDEDVVLGAVGQLAVSAVGRGRDRE
jgi:uncharacterized surface anchored protein